MGVYVVVCVCVGPCSYSFQAVGHFVSGPNNVCKSTRPQ